jgi:hypothetical protein
MVRPVEEVASDHLFLAALDAIQLWRKSNHQTIEFPGSVEDAQALASWDGDFAQFLKLIDQVAPPLVYIETVFLNQEGLEELAIDIVDGRELNEPDDLSEDPEDKDVSVCTAVGQLKDHLAAIGHRVGDPIKLSVGFVVGGVLHRAVLNAGWFESFVTSELEAAGIGSSETEAADPKQLQKLIAEAKRLGVVEKALADRRVLSAVSNNALYDRYCAVAIELVPGLEAYSAPGSWRYGLRSSLEQLARGFPERVATRRKEIETETLNDLETFALGFLADPIVANSSTVSGKEPLARRYVEEQLGFKSTLLASQLARFKPSR